MRRCSKHSGFTLVEVLVSVAIALLLIVGVNTVFKVTAKTVGAGESLLAATRDARTVLQTLLADLVSVDPVPPAGSTIGNAPFFIIRSEHVYAFRNSTDQQVATNPSDPSVDTNIFSNAAMFPGNRAPVPYVNYRSHRIDRLGFFSRGLFARQTASLSTQYVSTTTGAEAWIVYGHAQQPNKGVVNSGSGAFCDPGSPTATSGSNDYNFLASDWMLSRMAMVMIPPNATYDSNFVADGGGLSPLSSTSASSLPIYTSHSDLAQTSIAIYGSPTRANGIQSYAWGINPGPNNGSDWWDSILGYTPALGDARYQASPFILAGNTVPKITGNTLSTCAPDLIRGCSQFIVEYAGNFYTKNPNGSAVDTTLPDPKQATHPVIHAPVPDPTGQLDFYIDANGYQHTRWYGYPRSVSGGGSPVSAASGDVVPLRDVLGMLMPAWASANYADAERFSSNFPSSGGASPTNYWTAMPGSTSEQSASTRYTYTAAWGPDVAYMAFPKMIRIVIEVDDHEGRLNVPQRYEFVYDVQQ